MQSNPWGWIPRQLRPETQDVHWQYVGRTRFTDPFFSETLTRSLILPENSREAAPVTSLKEMTDIARHADSIEPSVFIFHVSRCGSTLVSQFLGLEDACVTLSEVSFFDTLLRARFQPALAEIVDVGTHLPAAIRLHGQRRFGTERFLAIKLDSWHIAFHAELRALYPRTPFVLLYREPGAILRSHQRQPGMHAVPGLIEASLFGFSPEVPGPGTRAEHLSAVLAFYYERFLAAARTDPRTLAIEYQPDMIPVVDAIARFAEIDVTPAHRQKMQARAAFHGKAPETAFQGDPSKQIETPLLPHCLASYEALARWNNDDRKAESVLEDFNPRLI